jgi:alginate O-acetyltransferase complex protein AlgI
MLFNSYEFIFLFLPITFGIYFWLNAKRLTQASKGWLVFASLFFYSWWNIIYLPLILGSILFNFTVGSSISKMDKYQSLLNREISRKALLVFGVASNLILLGYFKYMDFFIANANVFLNTHLELMAIVLPLGISFFTFTQIAYLVDAYRDEVKEMDYLNYTLFVTFFPHLLAGPILHHKEMMPQFDALRNKVLNYKNISIGLFIFSIGLFKKVVIADTLALSANTGFDTAQTLNLIEAWVTSLSYTFQLYFDFSGYTDMALGVALLFNIRLPINFNSPYKALDIQDFWRRWHITLSRFLRDYIYIPLGGNRNGNLATYSNLMITFILGGLWHGAGWTFIFWGVLHGAALVLHRFWKHLGLSMHNLFAWFITFNFINITWIFFRAKEWEDALKVLHGMMGLSGIVLSEKLSVKLFFLSQYGVTFGEYFVNIEMTSKDLRFLAAILFLTVVFKNTNQRAERFKPNWITLLFTAAVFIYTILNLEKVSEFLYFNF